MGLATHDNVFESPMRSAVFYPTTDSRREVSQFDRLENARLGRWAYENLSLARHLVECMTAMVVGEDGFQVAALTTDKAWNAENEARWNAKAKAPGAFDIRRRWDFTQALEANARNRMIDGDFFTILTKNLEGTHSRFSFHEGTMVKSPTFSRRITGERWEDGVRLDGVRGPAAYNFVDSDRAVGGSGKSFRVQASGAIHFADVIRPGHTRGTSQLGVSINDLLDRSEIKSFVKMGVKMRNQQAVTTSQIDKPGGAMRGALAGGSSKTTERDLKKIFGGGEVVELGKDGKFELLQDASPHMNYQEWDRHLIAEISLGFGLPVQVVWAMKDLTAANSRFVLEKTQTVRGRFAQKLVRQVAQRMYVYDTALAIKHGLIREPNDPFWWAHGFLLPAKLTIDRGRLGALNIQLNRRGLITAQNLYGCESLEWQRETDQWALEEAYRTSKLLEELGQKAVSLDDYLRLSAMSSSVSSVGDEGASGDGGDRNTDSDIG